MDDINVVITLPLADWSIIVSLLRLGAEEEEGLGWEQTAARMREYANLIDRVLP